MITHDSRIRVIFTNEQKLGQICNAIATDGQFRVCKCIVKLKKACIFIDFHLDVELQQDVYQIGVGIIEHTKVIDPIYPKATFEILPSKGALPAKGVLDSKSSS